MTAASAPAGSSLRTRLVVSLVVGVTLLWALAMLAAGLVVRQEVDRVFDSALQEVTQGILPLAYADILNRDADENTTQRVVSVGQRLEYISYVVRDKSGRVLLHSNEADLSLFPADLKPGFVDANQTRFYTESAVRGTIFATAVERPGHRREAILGATMAMAKPLLILVPTMIVGIWWLVNMSFRPVTRLAREIARRGGRDLSEIPASGLPREIEPVGGSVNGMLARLRRTLDSERAFTANSAHELRTPLAGALLQTQRVLADITEPTARSRLQDVETSLQRLSKVSEKLLQLAKAEGSLLVATAPQDVRPALHLVLRDFREDPRLDPEIAPEPVLAAVDIDAFAIVARNLIENALRYGKPGADVVIVLDQRGLFVRNYGPVLSQDDFARLKRRFERGANRAEGAGLGLAIVDAIARGAGCQFLLASPPAGWDDGVEMQFLFSGTKD